MSRPGTVYWYGTTNHMKMAENAGIKHIKASRVFSHPKLASSNAGASKPETVDMITRIEYISPLRNWCPGQEKHDMDVPLINYALETSGENVVDKEIGPGRTLFIAYSSHEMLTRYVDKTRQYSRSIIDEGENKMAELSAAYAAQTTSKPEQAYELATEDRELPEWMLSRRKTPKPAPSGGDVQSGQSASGSLQKEDSGSRSGSTVYMMSERELVETARRLLLQAGQPLPTEAEVEDYQQQQRQPAQGAVVDALSPDKSKVARRTADAPPDPRTDDWPDAPGPSRRKLPPSRRRIGDVENVLDELFDFGTPEKLSPRPPKPTSDSCWVADTQVYNPDGNNFAVPKPVNNRSSDEGSRVSNGSSVKILSDSLVLKTSSSGKSSAASSKQSPVSRSGSSAKTIPDSLVLESSSINSSKSSAQRRSGSDIISDSLVMDTESRSSSRPSVTTSHLSDSLVTNTKSTKSSSSKSPISSAQTRVIPDSLVPNTSSEQSGVSKASYQWGTSPKYVSDSFVPNTSSSKSNKHSRSSSNSGSTKCVYDSFVKDTSSSSASIRNRQGVSMETVPDSFVKASSSSSATSISNKQQHHSDTSVRRVSDSLVGETPSPNGSKSPRTFSKSSGNSRKSADNNSGGSTYMIPESPDVFDFSNKGQEKSTNLRSNTKGEDNQLDISFLDDLI